MSVLPLLFSFNYSLPSFYNLLLIQSLPEQSREIMNDGEREGARVCVSLLCTKR
ncbi:hypothetical protein RchiOBHm_Chr1g0340161 [Rosa chinensis]|uniref:Uncharacterized protein n=1 Tax=Rosa chinensis TaxID=74649 RepID=A0A2P6SDE6_ROSCH|nr:hypothetical protein RchiOBHm_Chr1g0340161 [Rosa chinensis]